MNRLTSLFLVLLQLAIGWHFLYEGWWKVKQQKEPWTSKGYIRNAAGPFALPIRWGAGDPEVVPQDGHLVVRDSTQEFLAHFAVKPFDSHQPPDDCKLYAYMPPALDEEWNGYFEKFLKKYQLDDPDKRVQKAEVECEFLACKNDTVKWLLEGKKKVKPPHVGGSSPEVPETTPQRVQKYVDQLRRVHDLEVEDVGQFGPRETSKVRKAQTDADDMRRSLRDDLNEQTAQMASRLRSLLTYEQKRAEAVPVPVVDSAPPPTWERITWIDWTVKYGLLAVGAGLLLGLFTRLACVVGALFLLAFYLAMPPLPGVTEGTAAKGHYLIINENIIETLALLTIAVSHPARRYGLDAWVGLLLRPFRRSRQPDWQEAERRERGRTREALAR